MTIRRSTPASWSHALVLFLAACGTSGVAAVDAGQQDAGQTGDPFDVPIDRASHDQVVTFNTGDDLFGTVFREFDGLGPLYVRQSCTSCHANTTRGPGFAQKMAVVEADGFTPAADQSILAFGHTIRPFVAAGAKTPLVAPADPRVKVTLRVGPPLLGHGYMEAVLDSEIERVAAEQAARTDAIHGQINHVTYTSEPNSDVRFQQYKKGEIVIGRFGLKARQPSLDDFVADALQNDIGITSPMRPAELPNPDGLTDDLKPGVDVPIDFVNGLAMYVRLNSIPRRDGLTERGRALFSQVKCDVCHVPALKTRPDYPIPQLAGVDAAVYTDFLLHRWSDTNGDGVTDGQALSNQWRTAPLIGLRFNKTFLHDGRAHTVDEAILQHDGEPGDSARAYVGLPADDRKALLDFVGSL
jgi:CxxC motif-containing protein (DUF1111 family)